MNIADNDTASHSSSPNVSLQVGLPAEEQGYPLSSSESDSDSTASDSILDSRLNTPQAPHVALARSPSPRRFSPCTCHLLRRFRSARLPPSIASIVDYEDDTLRSISTVSHPRSTAYPLLRSPSRLLPWRKSSFALSSRVRTVVVHRASFLTPSPCPSSVILSSP